MHLALTKIGVPWQAALDMSESEAAAYLDVYSESAGLRKKPDADGARTHYRAVRRLRR